MPEETTETNTRTRIKFSQNSKGLIQWEISTEYDSPEKSIEEMSKTIDLVRALLKEKGLTPADETAA